MSRKGKPRMKRAANRILRVFLKTLRTLAIIFLILWIARWGLVSLFGSSPVCLLCMKSHVVHDYYYATGIRHDIIDAYPDYVEARYGEPKYVEEIDAGEGYIKRIYNYGDFGIIFGSFKPGEESFADCEACGFVLYSPEIKIRYDIHVGSTREQIIHAYEKCANIGFSESHGGKRGDSVRDTGGMNDWSNSLKFTYDENDVVTSITYYHGSRYDRW